MPAHTGHRKSTRKGDPIVTKVRVGLNLNARVAWEVRGAGATALRSPRRPAMAFARNRACRGGAWGTQIIQAGDMWSHDPKRDAADHRSSREKIDHEGYLGTPPADTDD